ncbi:hypothetical protein Cni_G03623 [Canna indica]|uniref:PB1 domain-containing protein n=1 Tax=Canna indica TaxID=4628 RepID=A0AAQ3JSU0_9LILI|nr:hypothetical protein Cni_G03623 [Canna indica]
MDQGHVQRVVCNEYQNFNSRYEDLTGILGLRGSASEGYPEVSNSSLGNGHALDVKCIGYTSQATRTTTEDNWGVIGNYGNEHSETCSTVQQKVQIYHWHYHESGAPDSPQSGKMKFLCSFGGKILPRPGDGKLRYVGGETRIISIKKNITFKELMHKTLGICKQPHTIKYQLPGEELDALISVASDEDLQNMIEEYYGAERTDGSQRLRLFLILLNETESPSMDSLGLQGNSDYQYVAAVNNMLDRSPRKNSRRNSFSGEMGCHLDDSPSLHRDSPSCPQLDVIEGINAQDNNGVFTQHPATQFIISQTALKSPTQSPPFSPKLIQQRDTKHTQKQSVEDQINSAQLLANGYAIDAGYCSTTAGAMLEDNSPSGVEFPIRSHVVAPCENHRQIKNLVKPPFTHNEANHSAYFHYERPAPLDISFDASRWPGQDQDRIVLVTGSDVLVDPLVMPLKCSDAVPQNQVAMKISDASPIVKPHIQASAYTEQLNTGNFQGGARLMEENAGVDQLNFHFASQSISTNMRVPYSQQPEIDGKSYFHYRTSNYTNDEHQREKIMSEFNNDSQDYYFLHGCHYDNTMAIKKVDIQPQGNKIRHNILYEKSDASISESKFLGPTSTHGADPYSEDRDAQDSSAPLSAIISTSPMDHLKKFYPGAQINECIQDVYANGCKNAIGGLCKSSTMLNCDFAHEGGNAIDGSPVSRPIHPLEELHLKKSAKQVARECSGHSDSNGIAYNQSSGPISHLPSSIISQNIRNNQEHSSSSTSSVPPFVVNEKALDQDLLSHGLPLSLLQNSAMVGNSEREVSRFNQIGVDCSNLEGAAMQNLFYTYKQLKEGAESMHEVHDRVPVREIVAVEDVTHAVPPGIPLSVTIVPHVLHEDANDVIKGDSLLQNGTDADIYPTGSENEDMRAGVREEDEFLSDATIAEIEAGIYGLQLDR